MKKWINKRIERLIDNALERIEKGLVEIDLDRYAQNRELRNQREDTLRKAEKAKKEKHERLVRKKAAEAEARVARINNEYETKKAERERKQQDDLRRRMIEEAEMEAKMKRELENQLERSRKDREERRKERALERERQKRKEEELLRRAKARLNKLKSNKDPLFQRMEERYKRKLGIQEERYKNRLKELKARNAPLDMKSINEAEKRYLAWEARMQTKAKGQAMHRKDSVTLPSIEYYRGKAHKRTEEEEQMRQARLREDKVKKMIQRKKNYGNLIREMFVPKVDERKKSALERWKENERAEKLRLEAIRNRDRTKDMRLKPWQDLSEADREYYRKMKRKIRKDKRKVEEKERSLSAPDYLRTCKVRGRKKQGKKSSRLADMGTLSRNVGQLEKEVAERTKALRKSREIADDLDAVEQQTNIYIRLAQEKMRLLSRVRQSSR